MLALFVPASYFDGRRGTLRVNRIRFHSFHWKLKTWSHANYPQQLTKNQAYWIFGDCLYPSRPATLP